MGIMSLQKSVKSSCDIFLFFANKPGNDCKTAHTIYLSKKNKLSIEMIAISNDKNRDDKEMNR